MKVIAFAGPSLPAQERAQFRGVTWAPPAEAGDLLRLGREEPLTICLIDGYFDHRPAVRHKELLLLLSEGARIFGASSIGALRAAEMDRFGMIGVGAIYRAYAEGLLDGDDEVALVHGPEEWDWRPLSVPVVEVRDTLLRAVRARIIASAEARVLLTEARAIHYTERSWEGVASALPAHRRESLLEWQQTHGRSLKTLDALACLRAALQEPFRTGPAPAAVRTCFLEDLAEECGVELADRGSAGAEAVPPASPASPPPGRGGGRAPSRAGAGR